MPVLSFVVPVYNTAPYLRRCLDSILKQSFSDFEVIAVNDGSTDESISILSEYEKAHPEKIRVFQKENGGLSDARNFGLARAEGKYIAFVDSDDFLLPSFAQKTVPLMEKEELDLLFFDFYYHYDSGKDVYVSSRKHFSQNLKREALVAPPMAWMRLYRRSILDDAPFQKGLYYEDLEMTPGTVLKSRRVGHLPEALYFYYQREGSIMRERDFSPKFMDIFTVTDSIRTRFLKAGMLEEYRSEIEYLFLEHLYRSAALRFSAFPQRKELFRKLRDAVEGAFPEWRANPYLPKTSLFFRLVVSLTGKGRSFAVKLLGKLKG